MHIPEIRQIATEYDAVYLAPHLDDAVLSCAGAIRQQQNNAARILVITICTAAPAASGPFSELAQAFHRAWQLDPAQVVAARLREDALALEMLGADWLWAGMLDAIYRLPQAYHSRETLFATPAPNDPLLPALRSFIAALHDRLPHATFYAPLGVGSHVDHLITCSAAQDCIGGAIRFYEDFPYVARLGALEQRLNSIGQRLGSTTVAIAAELNTKIAAIAAYASQLDELFGSKAAMAEAVSVYAQRISPDGSAAERIWFPAP